MRNSIQHFIKNGIPELEKIRINFFKDPSCINECIEKIIQIVLEQVCIFISFMLEEYNTLLEESMKRQMHWQIKDRATKSILTSAGTVTFTHTRFKNKETGETAYLLDRLMGWESHARISGDAKARILGEAVQSSYEKAGKALPVTDCVCKETVMRHVRNTSIPSKEEEKVIEKKKVKYLYVEADEDHAALQFHEKKGDIKRFKGHADNCQIVKLVYLHEGYKDTDGKRMELKNVVYFGGVYKGKDNEKLWKEVKAYIEKNYEAEKIYFYSDGGAWMKKGVEILGAELALDGFHIQEYIRRMALAGGGVEENMEKLEEWVKNGKKRKLEEWAEEKIEKAGEKEKKRLEQSWKYIKNNWKGIKKRIQKGEGITGSSTESHVSHVFSSRISSRPMGWCRDGLSHLAKLRIYWKNGGDMLVLPDCTEEKEPEEKEEEQYLSSSEILSWEKKHAQTNGKYIEALQASVSHQISAKIFFNASIAGLC